MTQIDAQSRSENSEAERWLASTEFIDHEHPDVLAFATETTATAESDVDRAVALFYAVRDGWWYDPYTADMNRPAFKASAIVGNKRSWCVPKSILLTAAARAVGIPSRLGFADVRNHLQSEKLVEKMGTDLFVFHGYSELLLEGEWRKASAAFNLELCERFGTLPLEFDGRSDALLHEFDESGNRHMEYVTMRGTYDEFPFDEMTAAFAEVYDSDESAAPTSAEEAGDQAFSPTADQ